VLFYDNGKATAPGTPDFTQDTLFVPGTRVAFTGPGTSGCLTAGPTNRQVRVSLGNLDLADDIFGVPYRVPSDVFNVTSNSLRDFSGQFWNDTSRGDPSDPRFRYSSARDSRMGDEYDPDDPNTRFDTFLNDPDGSNPMAGGAGQWDWPAGPQGEYDSDGNKICGYWHETPNPAYAANCPLKPGQEPANKWLDPNDPNNNEDDDSKLTPVWQSWRTEVRSYVRPGSRQFDTQKFLSDGRLNPNYNPFYDPRMDVYFDISEVSNITGTVASFAYPADPGNVVTLTPQLYDPFRVNESSTTARFFMLWGNAYDPSLDYDVRNSLETTPGNLSLFNWVCATTVGFSDLDPAACALTVFSSSKAVSADTPTRISYALSGFLSGAESLNGFLADNPIDDALNKGGRLPSGFGMPLVGLHKDIGRKDVSAVDPSYKTVGVGLDVFRTLDKRREWADRAAGFLTTDAVAQPNTIDREDAAYPWIYSRESESYNCLPLNYQVASNGAAQLCGGLSLNTGVDPLDFNSRYQVSQFLSATLGPEQEALIGCGPFYGTNCDANGMDLFYAEGSAILQSFLGADSLGISMLDLGIEGLVRSDFGERLMDGGSNSDEYRTDGRVIGSNYQLLRIDGSGSGASVALGTDGYLRGSSNKGTPCDIDPDLSAFNPDGSLNLLNNRISSRCWDLRPYYEAYGLQPGTSTFEILGLGAPKCTTADIGGLEGEAGILPGCRNKWDTILYAPSDDWDPATGLHPNNPDAGYIGNNHVGQILSYKVARADTRDQSIYDPRTSYRQWRTQDSAGNFVYLANDAVNTNLRALNEGGTRCGSERSRDLGLRGNWLPENHDCFVGATLQFDGNTGELLQGNGLPDLSPTASLRFDSSWATDGSDPRYEYAKADPRSGLNWGVYDAGLKDGGCSWSAVTDPNPGTQARLRQDIVDDPDCYRAGWRQQVDGDPDRLGLFDDGGNLKYPDYLRARGANPFDNLPANNYGTRVENGCTQGLDWAFMQRTSDGILLAPPECAPLYISPKDNLANPTNSDDWARELLGGTGHPFTGESFSSEMAGMSFNFMMLLVAFSDDFADGLASVRGFVNPEVYESRYIYDEDWMWNTECDGTASAPVGCNGRRFIQHPDIEFIQGGDSLLDRQPQSVYGDPNFDLNGQRANVRQVAGWRTPGLFWNEANGKSAPINPLPAGRQNKLQRDPSVPNIFDVFPDLVLRECKVARLANDPNPDLCTTRDDWDVAAQQRRLGPGGILAPSPDHPLNPPGAEFPNEGGQNQIRNGTSGGLLESMIYDYAFTGSENMLMAMLPYCEDLQYGQVDLTKRQPWPGSGQTGMALYGPGRIDCTRGENGETLGRDRCNFIMPQNCDLVQAIFSIAGQKRNTMRAGGNGTFGRRTMQWQSGNEIYIGFDKRNVLGFSTDFAEDFTKSSWSMEFTWIGGVPAFDTSTWDYQTDTNDFNLTVSIDRPTFINFLNANRTFFINTQWFFQYRDGWNDGMGVRGPWNVLATFAIFTGYFQDRLNPRVVLVYDFQSNSGGLLPQVNYRFSENFSLTIGASIFMGEERLVDMAVNPIAPAGPRAGPNAYMDGTSPALSLFRDRDEIFMSLRYTF
jgi:hypothetical protein